VRYASNGDIKPIRASLRGAGAVYVRNVRDEPALTRLASSLGRIIEPGAGMPTGAHTGTVYSVEVHNQGRGLVDRDGHVIRSSTHLRFPLHTDGYNLADPPRLVFLLCAREGSTRALSYISDAWGVIESLSPDVVSRLAEPSFPSRRGPVSILSRTARGSFRVRFNEEEMERAGGPLWSEARRATAREFGRALRASRGELTIRSGDCLVLDNYRVCHGRAPLPAESVRVLKRVWVR